ELDARFRYVLIDEYQDTNQAQYALARGLSVDYPNLCVVGDPDQCLSPGTAILTPNGLRPIEELREGDRLLAGVGCGRIASKTIDKVMVNPFRGLLTRIRVEGGIELLATPNHVCFAREGDGSGPPQKLLPEGEVIRSRNGRSVIGHIGPCMCF